MLYRSTLILVLAGFLFSSSCFAAPTVHFGPTPTWVKSVNLAGQQPNIRDVNDGYYLALFEQEHNVETDEVYKHIVDDIVSDAGVQGASNLSINFNPAYEQLTVHQITVWRDGKTINKLEKDAFKIVAMEKELSMFIYDGNYTAYVILKDVRKGDKIEYSYTVSGSNPVFEKKFFTALTFQGTDPITQIHYRISAPASRTLDLKYFNDAEKPVVTNSGSTIVYDWNLLNIKSMESPDKAPGWFNPFPSVQISEYKSWSDVADWAYKINAPGDQLNGALDKRIRQLKKQYQNDSTGLFRSIVEIVQNEVRYMGVELGTYSHKANSPEKVYEQRYGDCKDKSLLLVSMLRNAGIKAEIALVNTYYKWKIEDNLPSPSSFNHAIVVAHLFGKEIWIDPTASYQGGIGTDFYCSDYGRALILTPGSNSLKPMPKVPTGSIKYAEEYEITNEQNPVSLTVYTTYTSNTADDIRLNFANNSKNDLEKNYLDYYSKNYPHIEREDSLIINDDRRTNTIETIERYTIHDFFEFDSASHQYYVNFYAGMIRDQLPTVKNKKNYPIAVNYPYNIHYAIYLNAQINWQLTNKHEQINRNAYSFSYNVSTTKNKRSLDFEFTYLKDHIAQDEIAQYEKDRKNITDNFLSYTFTDSPASNKNDSGINYWAILSMIVLFALCAYSCMRIYRTKTSHDVFVHPQPRALGGWLILPVIGLAIAAVRISYSFFKDGFFTNALWHAYDMRPENISFKALIGTEFIFNIVRLCLVLFCLLLIYKKRDILPKSMKILYVGSAIFIIVDNFAAHILFPTTSFDYKNIFQTIIATCIWVPYFSIALRVKETFTIPYPNLVNNPVPEASAISEEIKIEADQSLD